MTTYRLTFGRACSHPSLWLEHEFTRQGEAARFTANLVRAISGLTGVLRDSESSLTWRLSADRPRVSLTGGDYHFTLERIES